MQRVLHRDSALSLRGLAVKIGASPNYISQTLNDHLGVSFFDFVNGFRVDEAEALLRETDRSVTNIAFDVGFNSQLTFNASIGAWRRRICGAADRRSVRANGCPQPCTATLSPMQKCWRGRQANLSAHRPSSSCR